MKKIIYLALIGFISITCYGEIDFSYQFSVPVDTGNSYTHNLWLADGNGDGQDEFYVLSIDFHFPANRSLAEYDLNGNLLSVHSEPFPENIMYTWGSIYEAEDSVYYLEVNARICDQETLFCELKTYDHDSQILIDSLSVEIGMYSMSGYDFTVRHLNVIEIDGLEYLYLGISKSHNFGCEENYSDPFMYKCSFDQGMLGVPEEIPGVGTSWLFPDGADSIMSIGYSRYHCIYVPDYSICALNSVSFDSPTVVNEILQVEIDQANGLLMQFQNNFDDHYQDYGLVVWESLNKMLHCYEPDLSDLIWETPISSPSVINMGPSTCVTTNMGSNFIMYFFNDTYVEVINRITGNVALREHAQIVPFKILQTIDGELLFLTESDSLINVYTLAEEIQLENNENEISANSYKLRNYPNPFNPETMISFNLPQAAEVDLEIYNIRGQEVYQLAAGNLTGGNHEYLWNGEDEKGLTLSSGIYYYSLQINGTREAVGKCVLVK